MRKIEIRLPKLVKYLLSILASVLIVLFSLVSCLLFSLLFGSGLCGNEIFQEVYSPDKEYKAVIYQRDCGATTGFTTQISILNPTQELPNKNGNIFVMDGHPDWTDVQVHWETNHSISVNYSGAYEVFTKKEKFRDFLVTVDINYDPK